jgi:hypothetical protein
MNFKGGKKLREIIYSTADSTTFNYGLNEFIDFEGTEMLERAYLCNLSGCNAPLNMGDCVRLKELNCSNSAFTSINIADGAPITRLSLNQPTSLTLKNTNYLSDVTIASYD